jgi:hypothetical protein
MDYICIGEDCLPRSLFTFSKIKRSKSEGELTLPFDLMISDIQSIQVLLEDNFTSFFDDLKSTPHSKFINDGNFIQNKYKNFIFNHESESTCRGYHIDENMYTKNDFNEFKSRYQQRIANFKSIIHSNTKKCFIVHLIHIESYNYIDTFISFLFKKFGENIEIFVIFSETTKNIDKVDDDRVTYFSYALDGLWNTPPENLDILVTNFLSIYRNE